MILILIALGTILYRMGGMGGALYLNTKMRDIGTNYCALLISMQHIHYNIIPLILTFILQWLALSAYWKSSEDMRWYNWVFVAIGYSVSAIPLLWCGASLPGLITRSIILIITIPLVCEETDNVWIEEGYRGIAFCSTMLLL